MRPSVRPLLAERGEGGAVVGEGLVVGQVPVEHVQLVHLHQVQVVEQHLHREEVARRVEQHSAVAEPREVHHLRAVDLVLQQDTQGYIRGKGLSLI